MTKGAKENRAMRKIFAIGLAALLSLAFLATPAKAGQWVLVYAGHNDWVTDHFSWSEDEDNVLPIYRDTGGGWGNDGNGTANTGDDFTCYCPHTFTAVRITALFYSFDADYNPLDSLHDPDMYTVITYSGGMDNGTRNRDGSENNENWDDVFEYSDNGQAIDLSMEPSNCESGDNWWCQALFVQVYVP